MRLDDQRPSENIEDRRGMRGGGGGGMGGLGIAGRFGLPGLIIIGLIFFFFPGARPLLAGLLGMQGPAPVTQQAGKEGAPTDTAGQEVAKYLGSIEDVWGRIFAEGKLAGIVEGTTYPPATLVLFSGQVQSACGGATAAAGPFYCPADSKVYLDTSFFTELKSRFGAPGDFAQAYVIAHEVGHHIQNLAGRSEWLMEQRRTLSKEDFNKASVMMELQADCYAGVWGHYAGEWKGQIESGDLEEALNAANAIGDDTLQKQAQGYVVPDSFTHGSSEQRMKWFKTGYESGDPKACDTFSAPNL
ncbi:MAG: zinc metallopeptidase [Alphaproteobacteria bacterium]|nr:zinc metallopeptidase [Alphaproteobacteria bacterium]